MEEVASAIGECDSFAEIGFTTGAIATYVQIIDKAHLMFTCVSGATFSMSSCYSDHECTEVALLV